MVRQYSNKFRPDWAVTVPTQNSKKPASRALDYKKGEEISGATDGDSTKQKKEEGGGTDAPVASQLSSQESKHILDGATRKSFHPHGPSIANQKPRQPRPLITEIQLAL